MMFVLCDSLKKRVVFSCFFSVNFAELVVGDITDYFFCYLGISTLPYKNPLIMHYACLSIPVMWDCVRDNPVSDSKGVGILHGLENVFGCIRTVSSSD